MAWNDIGEKNLEQEALRRLEEESKAEKVAEQIFPESLDKYDNRIEELENEKFKIENIINEKEKEIKEIENNRSEKYFLMNTKSYYESIKVEAENNIKSTEEEKNKEAEFRENFKCIDKLSKEQEEIVRNGVIGNIKIEDGKVIELSEVSKSERDKLEGELREFEEEFQRQWEARRAEALENAISGKNKLSIKEVSEAFERAKNGHDIERAKRISEINKKVEEIDREYKSKHTLKGRVQGFMSKFKNNKSIDEASNESEKYNEVEKINENFEESDDEKNAESSIKKNEKKYLFGDDFIKEDSEELEDGENKESSINEKQIEYLFGNDFIKEGSEELEDEKNTELSINESEMKYLFENDTKENLEEFNDQSKVEKSELEKIIYENYEGKSVDQVLKEIEDEMGINKESNIEIDEVIERELSENAEKYQDRIEKFNDDVDSLLERCDDISDEDKKNLKDKLMDTILEQHEESINRSLGDHGIRHILANIDRSNSIYEKYCEATGREENAKEKLALIISQVHHDEGYLLSRKLGEDGDHDEKSSKIFEEKHKAFYEERIFKDEQSREYLEKAQEALGNHNDEIGIGKDREYIDKFNDDNLINNCLVVSDKLSVYADEKLPEYLVNNKEAMSQLQQLSYLNVLESEGVITSEEKREHEEVLKNSLRECIDAPDKERLIDELSATSAQFVLGMNNGRIGDFNFTKNEHGEVYLQVDIETIDKDSDTARYLAEQSFYKKNKKTERMEAAANLHERSVEKIIGDFGDYNSENSGVKLNFKEIPEEEINNDVLELAKEVNNEWKENQYLKRIREISAESIESLDRDLENIEDLDEIRQIIFDRMDHINDKLFNNMMEKIEDFTEEEKTAVFEISKASMETFIDMRITDSNKEEVRQRLDKFKQASMKIINKDRMEILNKWEGDK